MTKYYQIMPLIIGLSLASMANAEGLLERLRAVDLNNYALGVMITGTGNIYKGAEDSVFLYPYLTSMTESALTDDWLVVGEGDVGFRVVKGDWTFGAVGRVQTLGFDESEDLVGVDQRRWTLEVAPAIHYRAWPIQISFKPYFELSSRHDGYVSQLEFIYPKQFERGYMTLGVEFDYMSGDYSNYYFGVTPVESTINRPAYELGTSVNTELKLKWGYVLSEHWLLNGRVGLLILDEDVKGSPLVEDDHGWSASVGLAYNANVFQPRLGSERYAKSPNFQIKYTVLRGELDTKIIRDASPAAPGTIINFEDLLGLSNKETMGQLDLIYRFGGFHRLEFSYSDIERSSTVLIGSDITVGDQFFPAGAVLDSKSESETIRLSYGYSLIRDQQKEFGFTAGLHRTRLETSIISTITGDTESNKAEPILPTVGAFVSVVLGPRTTLGAEGQFFRLDYDRYEGSLNYARIEVLYQLERVGLGIGYSYYSVRLDSTKSDFMGAVEFRHQGPSASIAVNF
ncbi:MAG: outer membrane scaffolding protein for murein synthesis (MipA/OmpV family) [Oceanicoccus sp.]|jgi:outer membrane scaffolding protein for murein synthesis (MipA/OmpV family)